MTPPLIILGASARAAAASARRAGFDPWTADLFADADLRAMVPAAVRCPVGQYPAGFREILREAPDAPWVYTGGLENHPNLIRDLSEIRPLWGNGPNALAACRSPFTVEQLLREAGLPTAEVGHSDGELSGEHRWLRKPLGGTGGNGIEFATASTGSGPHFYQQFLKGTSYSAVFVRARGEVHLLGMTEQLIGPIYWLNAPPFRYAGNIGPVDLGADLRADVSRIGTVLGEGCGLLGLYGVDFILHAGRPYVVEVNPRYTASIEVIERAMGEQALGWHRFAFDPGAEMPNAKIWWTNLCGKAVVYASRPDTIPASYSRLAKGEIKEWFLEYADIPDPGETVESAWPILSVLVDGEDRNRCVQRLRNGASRALGLLTKSGTTSPT